MLTDLYKRLCGFDSVREVSCYYDYGFYVGGARSCRGCPHLTKDDVCTKRGFTFFRYEEMVEAMKTCTEACVR